ncbi:hypothetical protein JR316_0001768 [Psilocybe cubensis]|uniref:Uncharacterized protein n=1 Tax=Psilocybe cubensis TaxID=181762 RepID=A0ACB8HAB1_PSICU|nr:hypothetical protein JR316_0001768 [Psilocybe cubensis]KAH9484866.1 hypothetical protein JR316_0001768 [Psilocybe cubensis]
MTQGPPSSEASSSKSPAQFAPLNQPPPVPRPSNTYAPPPPPPVPQADVFTDAQKNLFRSYVGPVSTSTAAGVLPPSRSPVLPMTNSNPYAPMLQTTYNPGPQRAFSNSMPFPARPATAKTPQPQPQKHVEAQAQPSSVTSQAPKPLDPKTYKNWDQVVREFLLKTKMTEALKGFENDMLVLNPDWERTVMAEALKEMVDGLQAVLLQTSASFDQKATNDRDPPVDITSTEDTSLNEPLRAPPQINKSISQFLARTRARNDASNRAEFLKTLAEKRREQRTAEAGSVAIPSCARVDAKPIDRDKQIKYDIAKYGEGPLLSTTKNLNESVAPGSGSLAAGVTSLASVVPPTGDVAPLVTHSQRKRKLAVESEGEESQAKTSKSKIRKGKEKEKDKDKEVVQLAPQDLDEDGASAATSERYPGLDNRLNNVETHLALRYVPTPPRTLMARLKFIEDHIIKLEKEYPPWAALHFNQPNRGWPPPPRATPIIVPTHLRTFASTSATPAVPPATTGASYSSHTPQTNVSSAPTSSPSGSNILGSASASAATSTNAPASGSVGPKQRKATSSLHKAVLERLEVQRARSEMGGGKGGRE